MTCTTPPFRADHVGSLLRPPAPAAGPRRQAAGRITADELRAIEDDAIRDVVRMQADVGLRSATDGEFRRTSWHMDFIYRLGGVVQGDGRIRVRMHNERGRRRVHRAGAADQRPDPAERAHLRRGLHVPALDRGPGVTAKLTIPSPSMVHYRGGRAAIDPDVYADEERVLGRPVRRVRRPGARDRPRWAAPTCSSTTPAWPTSTTRPSGPS